MANYASTVLLAARAIQQEKWAKKFEGRPETSFLMDLFLKDRDITVPNLAAIHAATTQTSTMLYPTKTAYTVGSAKSCTPTGEQGDSSSVNLTWYQKQVEVITSYKRHSGNEINQVSALAWELLMAEQALWKDGAASMEVALLAFLDANRTQVNALSAGGGHNTWDAAANTVDVLQANKASFYNYLMDEMALNNYSGQLLEAYNTAWGANIRSQANQGVSNATNTAFQYINPFDTIGYASNLIIPATNDQSSHYIIPVGGVTVLDWNDPLNREGKMSGDLEWGLYESRFFPGLMLDLFTKTSCASTAGSGGATQDYTTVYELTLNYALAKQPLSVSGETPIFKYNVLV